MTESQLALPKDYLPIWFLFTTEIRAAEASSNPPTDYTASSIFSGSCERFWLSVSAQA